jgi:hypothetical protein
MQFNDVATSTGLCQDIDFLIGTTTTNYPIVDKTRNINAWYRRVVGWIWDSQGDWQFDDSNYSTLPIATTDLVNNQQDYELPKGTLPDSYAEEIERVEVLDLNGDYQLVRPIDKSEIHDVAMSEFFENAGLPIYYDLIGRSIMLYPKPIDTACTLTAGLKIYMMRDIYEFDSADTIEEPGFAKMFHRILSFGAAADFAFGKGMTDKIPYLTGQITEMKDAIQRFYSKRNQDYGIKIKPTSERYT